MPDQTLSNKWELLRKHNHSAFEDIYLAYWPDMLRYGTKIYDDREEVKDCINQLFSELWESAGKLPDVKNVKGYLLVILKRKLLARMAITSKMVENNPDFDNNDQIDNSIEDLIIKNEISHDQGDQLKEAYSKLTSRQKEVIFLKFTQGLGSEQVAEIMDINTQSVKNHLHEGVSKLRNSLTLELFFVVMSVFA